MRKLLYIFLLFSCSGQPSNKELNNSLQQHPETSDAGNPVVSSESNNTIAASSVQLIERIVLERMEVLIPRDFTIMDNEMMEVKYPQKIGTSFIAYTNIEGSVNIAFEHSANKATMRELPMLKNAFEQQFNQPGIDFRKSEIRNINGTDFIVIEMITPAVDTHVYNLMFITSSDSRLLIGTFNCTIGEMSKWQTVAERIVASVKIK
jgi:hypothetical protein